MPALTAPQARAAFGRAVPGTRRSPLRGWQAAAVALGGGLLGAAAFPQLGWWWAAPISAAALSVAVHGQRLRRGAWLGFLWGLAFFVPLLHWTSVFVGAPPWLILSFAEAGYIALLAPLLCLLQRLPLWPLWVGPAWVAQEALRDRAPFGGFPWGRWAFSQAVSPAKWFAALGGAPAVTAVVGLAAGLLAWSVLALLHGELELRRLGYAGAALACATAVLASGAAAAPVLRIGANSTASGGSSLRIALIQGDVPQAGLEIETRQRQVLDNHVQQTLKLAAEVKAGTAQQPDLVLWPENSSDIDPYQDATAAAEITQAAQSIDAPILVGAILNGPGDKVSNVGILWSPTTGPGDTYTKRHPVPFGEYIPLRSLARKISKDVDLVPRDMAAGTGDGLITGGPAPIGDVICFEVAYDSLVRSSVLAGAQFLVVQTNNATFGHTAETYQQLAMSQLRAVEHGREVLQVATSGKSAVIGPNGDIEQQSGALYTPAILEADVPLRTSQTLATRLGAIPEWAMTAVALLGGLLALLDSRRRRRGYDPASTAPAAVAPTGTAGTEQAPRNERQDGAPAIIEELEPAAAAGEGRDG
jgi:apolipoprotein N-acyltransferase